MLKKQYSKKTPVCTVTFSLPLQAAPEAKEVMLLGDFNNWSKEHGIIMQPSAAEYTAVLELEAGRRYEFRYLIDNNAWENDWEADGYVPTPFGVYNSILILEEMPLETPVAEGKKPAKKSTAKKASSGKDDLTKIEGIGPKIAEILAKNGIATFADLSQADVATLKAALEAAGSRYKMHDPATWPQQAQLAAAGQWDALVKLQEELKGGKVVK